MTKKDRHLAVFSDLYSIQLSKTRSITAPRPVVNASATAGARKMQSWLSEGTMVPYDAEIIVTYHLKKEIEYPFNSREVSKMTFEQVADRLLDLGFTEVYTLPLRDLKTGWIKKENSVLQVVIAGVESIRRGMALEYDKKITVQYHSFAK